MLNLDLISQVLFVALMAMLLYVLYRRFVAMMMRGRITGSYARVASCAWTGPDQVAVSIETEADGQCLVHWEGGQVEFTLIKGHQVVEFEVQGSPEMLQFDFGNQMVRRKVDS